MEIRKARPKDFDNIARFYRETGYTPEIHCEDDFWVAKDMGELLGVARLCEENGFLVLRGMQVATEKQRTGIGTALLNIITSYTGSRECYCIPYQELVSFYNQGGFIEVDPAGCPAFLADRAARYRRKLDREVVIMLKPLSGERETTR